MKLVKFSVTKYRSIIKAHNIPISNTTVLVGKNNEGKSNLLKALSTSMGLIAKYSHNSRWLRMGNNRPKRIRNSTQLQKNIYNWENDYPIGLQKKRGTKNTKFRLEFELTDEEILTFKKEIKSNLNGTLPLEITIGKGDEYEIKVLKGGRGNKTFNSKSDQISRYVAERISCNYIPAIRTHTQTLSIIDDLVAFELSSLDSNPEYKNALKKILEIQQPLLDTLSERILEPLSEFLPSINNVQINFNEENQRIRYRRDFDVIIDDGTPTSIEYKGDGVKSLAALGLLKNKTYRSDASIIAIEEPESHLHPGAIHQLQKIINSLEDENQIVISTHNPLFVNRNSIESNIIVEAGNAKAAKNIKEIRDTLGIKVSDNLTHAKYTLIVEGENDRAALTAMIPHLSEKISSAITNNILVILNMNGCGNLEFTLNNLQQQICMYHVLLDNDEAATVQVEKAENNKLLEIKYLTQTNCNGMNESELEDCIDIKIYVEQIFKEFGVTLNHAEFRKNNRKWSDRMCNTFKSQGKPFSEKTKAQAKNIVTNCIVNDPANALHPQKRSSIDSLISSLEHLVIEDS